MEELSSVVAPTEVICLKSAMQIHQRIKNTYIGTVCREGRREPFSVLFDIAVLRVEAAVVVARVVPVGNARVTRGKDDAHTLQRQLHPLAALAFLVELGQSTLDLAVRY